MSEQRCIFLVKECKTLNDFKQILGFACKTGLQNDPFLFGKLLLCAITVINGLDHARSLFSNFPSPDVFMYNTLIRGLSQSQSPQQTFQPFTQMRKDSVHPDSFSFAFLLKASANFRSIRAGIQLHCQALINGFDTHLFVATTLVSMYAECSDLSHARQVFHEMAQPNLVSWNAVITACIRCADLEGASNLFDKMPWQNLTSWNIMLDGFMKSGKLERARKLFDEMPQRDFVSWNTMVVGFAQNGHFEEAFGFFRELQVQGIRPNSTSLTGVLSVCAQAGALEYGRSLHGFMEKSGLGTDVSVSNALLDMYAKCGILDMAALVFNQIKEKSVISWTSMIAGLAMHGYGEEAIELFRKMENSGTNPDGVTFISVLYACSHSGLIETGTGYFKKMQEIYRIEPTMEHYGCMVDLYGRAGMLNRTYKLIINMPIEPNSIIWRTLLGACSIHGNVQLAELVKQKLSEIDPDNSGDHVLLSNIYASAGKWKEVAALRRSMTDRKLQKSPGWSAIEVGKVVYGFVVGDEQANDVTTEAYEKLREIMLRLRVEGYVAEVGRVLHDIEEEEKEDAVSRHSEKLAVALGMARLSRKSVIRIVKNLRICRDCHSVMKLISRVYGREIVVRDRSRFHVFREGLCSCKDYW